MIDCISSKMCLLQGIFRGFVAWWISSQQPHMPKARGIIRFTLILRGVTGDS
jgi:O-glycosyl hydrolase